MGSLPATSEQNNSAFITQPDDLASRILDWKKQGAHVLAPAIQVTTIALGYGVNASVVYLDPAIDEKGRGTDVYYDKNQMGVSERAPSKIGLGKLASAAGVSWIGSESGRRDPLTIQNLWIYQMVGVYLAYDGTPQTIHGEKEIDYRDGSAQIGEWSPARWIEELTKNASLKSINGWSESRVRTARMNGAERAETGAMERAIRMAFGIKHTYTLEELGKPFIALRVCPLVDMADPDVRRMVTEQKLAGVASLYAGTVRRGVTAAPVIDIATRREPVPVGASSTASKVSPQPTGEPTETSVPAVAPSSAVPPPATTASTTQPAPSTSAAGPEPENFIRDVKLETKPYGAKHAKAGQSFTKYHVIDGNGVEHITIKTALGQVALVHAKAKTPVVLTSAPNSFREQEISSIEPFADAAPKKAAAAPREFKL